MTRVLIERLENLNALHIACILGEEEIACELFEFLVKTTTDMEAKKLLFEFIGRPCASGNTVLHLASFMGLSRLVQRLIESGASVYKKNGRNYKPVDLVDDQETSLVFSTISSGM